MKVSEKEREKKKCAREAVNVSVRERESRALTSIRCGPLPGVRRAAFKADWDVRDDYVRYSNSSYSSRGITMLFEAEAEVLRSRNYKGGEEDFVDPISGRLAPLEAATIASKAAGKLGTGTDPPGHSSHRSIFDYDSDEDLLGAYGHLRSGSTGNYGFIREHLRRDVCVRRGERR